MMTDIAATIISFAIHLEDPIKDPLNKAQERFWLDGAGMPTPEGIALASALADQAGTRTSFRNLA